MTQFDKAIKRKKSVIILIWLFLTIFGIISTISIIRIPSESNSAFLFGLSKFRILIFFCSVILLFFVILITTLIYLNTKRWKLFLEKIYNKLTESRNLLIFLTINFAFLLLIICYQILVFSPVSNELVVLKTIQSRTGLLLIWIALILLSFFLQIWILIPNAFRKVFSPTKLSLFFAEITIFYFISLKIFAFYTWDIRFRGVENYIFLPAIVAITWSFLHKHFSSQNWYLRLEKLFLLITIFVITFTIYRHTSQWMDWRFTPSKVYWHLLAESFLQGRLFLIDPPTTHDLTFFQGNWYVPNPPLPAILLMPVIAVLGVNGINMVVYSIWIGALSTVLVYWLLEKASSNGILPTTRKGNIWVTAIFSLGTCFWWLAVMGRMWFLSQLFTVMFLTIAAIFVVTKKSPYLVGISLGLAILARPNIFTVWPFFLGIYIFYLNLGNHQINFKKVIIWSIKSAIPPILAVAVLLFYNYVRFEDFFDFGYVTISSADWITSAVRTYGMFHPHFFPSNFSMMFINHPNLILENNCIRFSASRDGYGILFMTPVIIYIFRKMNKTWWFFGAWISVGLSIALLLLYHNNGAWQLGYRYLMDFIIPILFLTALGVGKKPSLVFKSLAIVSILGNFFAIIWWFEKWWC